MYNPYNWKIRKNKECVMDELCKVCFKLDMAKIEESNIKNELKDIKKFIDELENEKNEIIKKISEHP